MSYVYKNHIGLGILLACFVFALPGVILANFFPGVIIYATGFFINWLAWTFLLFILAVIAGMMGIFNSM